MTRVLLAAAAGLLIAGAAQAQEGLPCLQPKAKTEFPQVLGPAFVRGPTYDYEAQAPGYGCSVRYKHPSGMWADVYVYSGGLGVIEDLPRDPRLLEQFQETMATISKSWETQHQAKVSDVVAQYEKRGRTSAEVMVGSATIDSPKQGLLRTHVQLWSGSGVIWKLRATFPKSDDGISDLAVKALAEALIDLSRGTEASL